MKKYFSFLPAFLFVWLMAGLVACSPKDISISGDEDVEGELGKYVQLSTDSVYEVAFQKKDGKMVASTTLKFEVNAMQDYKELSLTAAIVDDEDEPLCELEARTSSLERLIDAIRDGEGKVNVRFVSSTDSDPLTEKTVDKIIENGKSIRIIASEGTLNKTPEQIKAEQDSIARLNAPVLEITDFLDNKRSEPGFTGKLRDLKGMNEVIATLESKGFTLDKKFNKTVEDYDGGFVQMDCAELSRNVGSMTETVTFHGYPESYYAIDFCDNVAATDFMGKMTMDGYRNGISSDCYYAGSEVKRGGKKVTLRQIWEP